MASLWNPKFMQIPHLSPLDGHVASRRRSAAADCRDDIEARSLRENTADLSDAWVDIDARGEAWVKGMRVPMLKHAAFAHEERRPRKLLLHREQIDKLRGLTERFGLQIPAISAA